MKRRTFDLKIQNQKKKVAKQFEREKNQLERTIERKKRHNNNNARLIELRSVDDTEKCASVGGDCGKRSVSDFTAHGTRESTAAGDDDGGCG